MTETQGASAPAGAEGNLRAHCKAPDACTAKKPGRHCLRCAMSTPEARARRSASAKRAIADPAVVERRIAGLKAALQRPEVRAGRSAAMRRRLATPEARREHGERCSAGWQRALQDPDFAARQAEYGMRLQTPERQAKSARTRSIRRMAWCPSEYREENRRLAKLGFKLADRKAMIAEVAAKEARRMVAENARRQLERAAREKAQAY